MISSRMGCRANVILGAIVDGGFWKLSSYEQNREELSYENTRSKTTEPTSCE